MLHIVDSIKQLLHADNIFEIHQRLSEMPDNEQTVCYRSLLHRYSGEYAEERRLIFSTLNNTLYSKNAYIKQRINWYLTPLAEHLLPRPPLFLPSKKNKIPSSTILKQTCFVTFVTSLSQSFGLLVQQIESIKATQYYAHTPICIIDMGLTSEQKNILAASFDNLIIKKPNNNFEMTTQLPASLEITMPRMFIDLNFSEYRYYMWLQNDSWIQDENCIHDFLYQASTQGAGFVLKENEPIWTKHNFFVKTNALYKNYPQSYDDFLNKRTNYARVVFCIDKKTGFFETWRQTVHEILKIHNTTGGEISYEEAAFVYSIHTCPGLKKIKPLDHTHCFICDKHGLPVLGIQQDVLYSPLTFKPIGIIYLHNHPMLTIFPIMPMLKTTKPLTPEMLRINRVFFEQIITFRQTYGYAPDMIEFLGKIDHGPFQLGSCHYRSWPQHDKDHALNLIEDFCSKQGDTNTLFAF